MKWGNANWTWKHDVLGLWWGLVGIYTVVQLCNGRYDRLLWMVTGMAIGWLIAAVPEWYLRRRLKRRMRRAVATMRRLCDEAGIDFFPTDMPDNIVISKIAINIINQEWKEGREPSTEHVEAYRYAHQIVNEYETKESK